MSSDEPISSSNDKAEHVGSTWYYYRDRDMIKVKGLDVEGIGGAEGCILKQAH
jgi:hypothetical protein